MALAEHDADPALLSEAHLTRCISSTWVRDLPEAIDDADRAAVCFDDATSGFVSFRVGTNPGVVAHAIAGLLRWSAGYPDAAATSMQRALDLADALDHPYSLAFALHHATLLDLWRSDMAAVAARAEVSSQVADAHDYAIWWALATILRGAAMVAEGDPAAGLAELERGFDHYLALVTPPIFWPSLLTIRAAVHGDAGDVEGGLVVIEEAYASLGPDHPAAAEVALAHGDLLLATPDGGPAAEATFERVVRLAAARGARMVQLQALTRLAARRLDGSEGDDAHRALRALYDTFDEGHGEQPLQAAAAVLARRA